MKYTPEYTIVIVIRPSFCAGLSFDIDLLDLLIPNAISMISQGC